MIDFQNGRGWGKSWTDQTIKNWLWWPARWSKSSHFCESVLRLCVQPTEACGWPLHPSAVQYDWKHLGNPYGQAQTVCVWMHWLGSGGGGGGATRGGTDGERRWTVICTCCSKQTYLCTHTHTKTILLWPFQSSVWSNGVLSSYPVLALPVMSPASSPTLDSLSGEPHVSTLDCWRKQNSRSPSHTISLRLLTSVSFSFSAQLYFSL